MVRHFGCGALRPKSQSFPGRGGGHRHGCDGLQPGVNLSDQRTAAFARNQIGRALSQMLDELPEGATVALERLSVKDMRMKSRQMNRALRASQLVGYARDKLKFKLDERGLRFRSVQPAYSSQQYSQCGFTLPMNRRSQTVFRCLWCGFEANPDENAARNIAERFGDAELNVRSFREGVTGFGPFGSGAVPRLPVVQGRRTRTATDPSVVEREAG